ncbi:MAG TPA: DUF2721 domain-containing protein [Caulobacteraceae bacterium]
MQILTHNANLEAAAHVVQLSLAPVFLLSGTAALLSVFAGRLSRVGDQADTTASEPVDAEGREDRLQMLRWRTRALDLAVVLAAIGGVATCATVLLLFLGEVLGKNAASILFFTFGGAIVLIMGSLAAFVVEMLFAAHDVRRVVDRGVAESGEAPGRGD